MSSLCKSALKVDDISPWQPVKVPTYFVKASSYTLFCKIFVYPKRKKKKSNPQTYSENNTVYIYNHTESIVMQKALRSERK